MRISLIVSFLFLSLCCSCDTAAPVKRSFYYWKTILDFNDEDRQLLKDLDINRLYVRFFDVDISESGKTEPVGVVSNASSFPDIKIIPVIFITNRTLTNIAETDIPDLASKIVDKVNQIAKQQKVDYNELQLDCDWNAKSKDRYFLLLSHIKLKIDSSCIISATIRLHQIKYAEKTGVPPVDRGMLMFYNMGKLEVGNTRNPIYNKEDAEKYTSWCSRYALPLDVALPLFSWGVQIRNNKIISLLDRQTAEDFQKDQKFVKDDSQYLKATSSFFFRGIYFMQNDKIRIDKADGDECHEAAKLISNHLKPEPRSIVIFDYDLNKLKKYDKKDLEKVFNYFN